jgi:hypothetical protein
MFISKCKPAYLAKSFRPAHTLSWGQIRYVLDKAKNRASGASFTQANLPLELFFVPEIK